jgi:putative nucleotidyltransferase with HDIG domain
MFGTSKKTTRIGQWNGRRRSSRHDEPLWMKLGRRSALLRLGAVLAATLGATLLALLWGPGQPFRVGEKCGHDICARVDFEVFNQVKTDALRREAVAAIPPEERTPERCEEAREAVPPVIDKYPKSSQLVERGQPITESQLMLIQAETEAYADGLDAAHLTGRGVSLFLLMSLLALLVVIYVVRFQPSLARSLPKAVGACALALGTLLLALLLSPWPWHAVLVPLTVTALVLTLTYNPQLALMMSLSLTLATVIMLGGRLPDLLVAMGGQATAILVLGPVRTRTRLVEVGTAAGLAFAAMTLSIELWSGQAWGFIAWDAGRGLLWGVLAGFLVSGLLPLIERLFGVVTDVSLVELGDGSHPLLQELVRRAPGTYTHSMTVATLAEPAAEAIGANPLLARVGSYFHDVGKMLKPQYFIENQSGENRHDDLEPALSTLIIIGHVKDGVALAEQYRLPKPIVDFIRQHHGTTLVEYFYREALRQQEAQGAGPTVGPGQPNPLEPTFRYPGPKPQTRENGVVMLADAVESSSRALSNPTPGSLRKLVHDMLMKRLLDGQFDESGLTLTELHVVEESLCKGLVALYHSRIKYPEPERKAS